MSVNIDVSNALYQQLVSGIHDCVELSQKPLDVLLALREGRRDSFDLDKLLALLLELQAAAKQNAAVVTQLVDEVQANAPTSSQGAIAAAPAAALASPASGPAQAQQQLAVPACLDPATAESLMGHHPVQVVIMSAAHKNCLQTRLDGHVVFASASAPVGCNLHVWELHRAVDPCGAPRVAIRNVGNAMWLSAERGGALRCDRSRVRQWELWTLEQVPPWPEHDLKGLMQQQQQHTHTNTHTRPSCAGARQVSSGSSPSFCPPTSTSSLSSPSAVSSSPPPASASSTSVFALRSWHGQYLCVEALGVPRWPWPWLEEGACKAAANRDECNGWERLVFVRACGSTLVSDRALQSQMAMH